MSASTTQFTVTTVPGGVTAASGFRSGAVASDQVLYHLGERGAEEETIPACERHRVAMVGYSPFGNGEFPSPRSLPGRVLAEIARDRQVTPHAVALAFLVRRRGTFTIPKASRREHVVANAAAGELRLTPEEIGRIEAVARPMHDRRR